MMIYNSYSLYIRSFSYINIPELNSPRGPSVGARTGDAKALPSENASGAGSTNEASALPAMLPVSKESSPPSPAGSGADSITTLRFEQLRIVAEKRAGIDNAEMRVRENHGHRVARRRAMRRNMARFMKHLTRKIGKELRHFIRNADLTEEQASKLRDAFKEFKEGIRDMMHSLREGKNLEPSQVRESLQDIVASFVEKIEDALAPEARPEAGEAETIPINDGVPIKQEPVPIISDGYEEKSQVEALMVNISSSTASGELEQEVDESEAKETNLQALAERLKESIDKIFDRTMKKISKMLDKLTNEPPHRAHRGHWSKWSIEIDYISIYQTHISKEGAATEPAPSISNDERPTLYA